MSWEPVGFIFFSVIETFALYFLIMCMFRFRFREHLWQALALSLLINLQSFILRKDFDLGNLMPLVTIFFFILFFTIFVRMPLVLSLIATVSGYVVFGVVQCILAIIFFGSLDAVGDSLSNGYVLQLATGTVIIPSSWVFYRMGYGFTFDLSRLRFKFEDIMVTLLISLFLISITSILYFNQLYVVTIFFLATSAYMLYYSLRKDREHD
ncbi:hypothetical protein D3C76_226270 [compost metagenome]